MKLAEKAKYLVDLWNETRSIEKKYVIHVPEVSQMGKIKTSGDFQGGEWITVEPYIEGEYIKWNSNSGCFHEEKLRTRVLSLDVSSIEGDSPPVRRTGC